MSKTFKLDTPISGVEKWYVAGDWHSFHLHKPSFNILTDHALGTTKSKSDRRLIINGDFLDIVYGMTKNEGFAFWKSKSRNAEEFFIPNWEEELLVGNETLDELQSVFSQIIFINGNHDSPRLINIIGCTGSEYHYVFNINKGLNLEKRKIPEIGYNDWLDYGDVSITHGQAHGSTAVKKHYEKSGGRSCIFSHVHQFELKSFHSRGKTTQCFSLPAMCELNPDYMRNTDNNWSNGFGEVLMKPSGHFNFNVHQVWDNELVLSDGTILKG